VIEPFIYESLPARVIFGSGTLAQLKSEVERLGCKRALVLATARREDQARRIAGLLGDYAAGVFAGAVMHTPVEVTEAAFRVCNELGADAVVAVGGGSTTGLGKALALRTGLPQLVVPTTYAGSEMTPILGETKDGVKTTRIAHAVEALYAQDCNPIVSLTAEEGIAALGRALPRIAMRPDDREARSDALYGAWLCGICLGTVGMALHHKLCHTLGGSFDLPHAETHTIVLPHAVAYNAPAAPDAMARIARALAVPEAAQGLYALSGRLGAKRALKDIGMPEDGIERAADLAVKNPYWNPRPIERRAIRDLIARAWAGEPPQEASFP
jgi:maleylacetate reductase